MLGMILMLGLLPQAHAVRSTSIMPIIMDTVHGGTDGTQYCITADMTHAVPGVGAAGRVAFGYQRYSLSFRNLSDIAQTVKINVEAGTKVTSNYSIVDPAPKLTGPSAALTATKTLTVQLNPKEGKRFDLLWMCSKDSCWLNSTSGVLVGTSDAGAGPSAICLGIQSELHLSLTVDQDRGAIIGSIATSSHRALGFADKYNEPPPFVLINGGRPF